LKITRSRHIQNHGSPWYFIPKEWQSQDLCENQRVSVIAATLPGRAGPRLWSRGLAHAHLSRAVTQCSDSEIPMVAEDMRSIHKKKRHMIPHAECRMQRLLLCIIDRRLPKQPTYPRNDRDSSRDPPHPPCTPCLADNHQTCGWPRSPLSSPPL
jgi:hypothetical protein